MLRVLMAAESTYYESLASVRYVEEAKKGNRTSRIENAVLFVYMYRCIDGRTCPAISDIHRRLYIENSCKVFDFFKT